MTDDEMLTAGQSLMFTTNAHMLRTFARELLAIADKADEALGTEQELTAEQMFRLMFMAKCKPNSN